MGYNSGASGRDRTSARPDGGRDSFPIAARGTTARISVRVFVPGGGAAVRFASDSAEV